MRMDRDTITRSGARTPGVERRNRSHGGAPSALCPSAQYEELDRQAKEHKGRMQTARGEDLAIDGKAPSDRPALKP